MGAFAYFEANPEAGASFNAAMTDLSRVAERSVAEAYDFAALTPRTAGAAPVVVDVGGGHGALLAGILKAHPTVRGILFDQPHVVEGAPALLAAAGVADRCRIESGSFFDGVPAGGDAYVMKNIVHDWDDERAAAILRHCRAGDRPGGQAASCRATGAAPEHARIRPLGRPGNAGHDAWRARADGARVRGAARRGGLPARTRTIPTQSPFGIVEGVPAG